MKTIIIEDEERSREMLLHMLTQHFKDIEVLAVCASAEEGKAAIEELGPDLVLFARFIPPRLLHVLVVISSPAGSGIRFLLCILESLQ